MTGWRYWTWRYGITVTGRKHGAWVGVPFTGWLGGRPVGWFRNLFGGWS